MAATTNFDELQRLHYAAVVGGSTSRAWVEFASTMVDSFPHLYRQAERLNLRLKELERQVNQRAAREHF